MLTLFGVILFKDGSIDIRIIYMQELIVKGFVPMRNTAMVLRYFYTLVKELL
ncbi:hypothetical protein SAMN02799630_00955 [Paenibacillus sp. UNCCL117]|nr:hypothetical protein SAMN04488602_101757 [Paenibacillus sp. cl123]SFW20103.1 hypothetical protein SAMN02799630_00955 [Paenibacillus sp. UNCCL117]